MGSKTARISPGFCLKSGRGSILLAVLAVLFASSCPRRRNRKLRR